MGFMKNISSLSTILKRRKKNLKRKMIIHIKETSPIIASIGFPLSRDYEDVGLDLMLLIEPLEGQLLVPTSVATLMIAVGSSMRRAIIP